MSVQRNTSGRDSDGSTRIKVSGDTADDLYALCGRKETYEDVIRRLLAKTEAGQ